MTFFDPVPLMALEQIEDTNIRTVLQSIANGLQVRNGETGTGEHAFVTRADLTRITGVPARLGYSGQWPTLSEAMGQSTSQAITDVESAIVNSLAFQQLGDQVAQVNTDVIAEQTARIAAVQAEATARIAIGNDLSALVTRVGTAESNITTLQSTTSTQTTSISSLTTRVGTAESNITNLQSTTSTTSTNLSSLTTRVGTAESNISTLQTTTSNQATTLSTLTTTVGQKARTFLQASEPTASGTGDLWFDSDDSNKPYRWSGSAWVATDDTRIAAVQASITSEATTRSSADNAITSSMSTQFSTVNGNISSLQSTQTTLSNNVSTLSSSVSTLTATVGGHTTSIQNETDARVSADGQINAKYTVKIDSNGHVSGFGLISEANNSTPVSSFIVRADKFAVSNQTGSDTFVGAPFIVESGRVYMDSSYIKNLSAGSIDVEKLSGTTTTYSVEGTYTFTLPAGFTVMRLIATGGGGGGGGAANPPSTPGFMGDGQRGGGGGQGGTYIGTFTGLTPGSTYTVVVGGGGASGGANANVTTYNTPPTPLPTAGAQTTVSGPGVSVVANGGAPGSSSYMINSSGGEAIGYGGAGGAGGGAGYTGSTGETAGGWGTFVAAQGGRSMAGGAGAGGNGYISNEIDPYHPANLSTPGQPGRVIIEAYNPNGIVKRSEWDTLIAHLNARFTSYTWP